MAFFRIACLVCLIIITTPAFAAPYFDATSIAPTIIDPPLAKNSASWKQEITDIIALQKNADPEAIAAAEKERIMQPEMIAETAGLSRESHPALYTLLSRVGDTSRDVSDQAKDYWNTQRPYLSDPRVKALIDAHDNPAYPSGHTTGCYVWAYVMSMLLPEKREQFMARAETTAQHRVLVGMHYPHDLKGGKQLALLIVGGLLQNKDFQNDLAKARQELQ